MIKTVNAYGAKTKREVYGRDLEIFNRNRNKYYWGKEDDLIDTIAQRRLYPDIPVEFPGVPLESDYHLPCSVEEEEFVNENAASAAAAANADSSYESLQDNPGAAHKYSMANLVEVDSNSDDEDEDDNTNGNKIV